MVRLLTHVCIVPSKQRVGCKLETTGTTQSIMLLLEITPCLNCAGKATSYVCLRLDLVNVQMHFADYPWNTSTRLYPEYSLAADPVAVPLEIRTAIIEAMFE